MIVARNTLGLSPVRILGAILVAAALLLAGGLAGVSIAGSGHPASSVQTTLAAPVSGEHTATHGPR